MAFRLLLSVLLLSFASAAAADRPPQYFGLSLGDYDLTVDVDGDTMEFEFTHIGLQGGYRFSRFIALEGRAGYTRRSSTEIGQRSNVGMGGLFARFDLPFQRVSLYGMVGGSAVGYNVAGSNESEFDYSTGVGVELYGSPRTAINLEFISHADRTYEGISLGFIHHFNWPALRR